MLVEDVLADLPDGANQAGQEDKPEQELKDAKEFIPRQPRVPVTVIIQGEAATALPLVFSRDISAGGISLETSEALPPGSPVKQGAMMAVSFTLPFGRQTIRSDAKVVWVDHEATNLQGEPISLIGLEFVNPEPYITEEFNRYRQRVVAQAGLRQQDSAVAERVEVPADDDPEVDLAAASEEKPSAVAAPTPKPSELPSVAERSSGDESHPQVEFLPVKHYYENITAKVKHANDPTACTLFDHPLPPWEARAFLAQDEYWSRAAKPLIAGVAALSLKCRREYSQLKELYDREIHIMDEASAAYHTNKTLLAKLEPRLEDLLQKVRQANDSERRQQVESSTQQIRESITALEELVNSSRAILEIASSELKGGYKDQAYKKAPVKKRAKAPAKKVQKTKKESGPVKRAIIITLLFFTVGFFAYRLSGVFKSETPKPYSSRAIEEILPLNRVRKWNNWVFASIDGEVWRKMAKDQRQQKAEELFSQIQQEGFQFLEVKEGNSGKTLIMTLKTGKGVSLRTY